MNQKTGMQPDVDHVVGVEEAEPRARRAAEEQRDRDRRHRDDVHELGEEEDREPDARVLGVEPADELLLRLDEVERRVVRLGDRGDQEDHERRRSPGSQYQSPRRTSRQLVPRLLRRRSPRVESVPAWIEHADDREAERGLVARAAAPTRAPSRAAGTSSPTTSPRASRRTRRCPTSPGATARRSAGRRAAGRSSWPSDRDLAADRARCRTRGTRAGSTGTARAGTPAGRRSSGSTAP